MVWIRITPPPTLRKDIIACSALADHALYVGLNASVFLHRQQECHNSASVPPPPYSFLSLWVCVWGHILSFNQLWRCTLRCALRSPRSRRAALRQPVDATRRKTTVPGKRAEWPTTDDSEIIQTSPLWPPPFPRPPARWWNPEVFLCVRGVHVPFCITANTAFSLLFTHSPGGLASCFCPFLCLRLFPSHLMHTWKKCPILAA